MGNVHGRSNGANATAPALLLGSHYVCTALFRFIPSLIYACMYVYVCVCVFSELIRFLNILPLKHLCISFFHTSAYCNYRLGVECSSSS